MLEHRPGEFKAWTDMFFRTGPEGERLFVWNGLWGKPLILENDEQVARVRKKVGWMWIVSLIACLTVIPLRLLFGDGIRAYSVWLAALVVFVWVFDRLLFRREVRDCRRLSSRLPAKSFFGQRAANHTLRELCLLAAVNTLILGLIVWAMVQGDASVYQWVVAAVCCAVVLANGAFVGYLIWVKWHTRKAQTESSLQGGSDGTA